MANQSWWNLHVGQPKFTKFVYWPTRLKILFLTLNMVSLNLTPIKHPCKYRYVCLRANSLNQLLAIEKLRESQFGLSKLVITFYCKFVFFVTCVLSFLLPLLPPTALCFFFCCIYRACRFIHRWLLPFPWSWSQG